MNKKSKVILGILSAMLLLAGCASVGKSFKYKNIGILQIGTTTQDDAVNNFGEPYKTESIENSDGEYEIMRYIYGFGTLASSAARVLFLEFKGGVLNAYIYVSGFDEDATIFDEEAAREVKTKAATKAEVKQSLGEPSGKAIYPTTLEDFKTDKKGVSESWVWAYTSKSKGVSVKSIKSKIAHIYFDKNGKILGMEIKVEN